MIMTTPMVLPIPRGWTARPIPARMRTATPMITVTGMGMGMTIAMPDIRMNIMPT